MYYQQCMRCGRVLKPGSIKYMVSIRAIADFDGVIRDHEEDVGKLMSEALRLMEGMDESDLANDVYDELNLLLCKSCKNHFVRNPLNLSEDELSSLDPDVTNPVH